MNQPTTPAITATTVPASSALTMNGKAVSCWKSDTGSSDWPAPPANLASTMASAVAGWGLRQTDDDAAAVRGLEHLDRHAIQAAQRRSRDHLARRPGDRPTGAEVHHAVEVAQQRV